MKRRSFIKGVGALLVTPAMPTNAIAGLSGTVVTGVSAIVPNKISVDLAYSWCKMYAQNNATFKLPMLSKHLGFSEEITREVFQRLLKNKAIEKTAIRGVYKSTKPFADFSRMANSQPDPLEKLLADKKAQRAQKMVDAVFTPIPQELWLA